MSNDYTTLKNREPALMISGLKLLLSDLDNQDAIDGQVIVYNATLGVWELGNVGGFSGEIQFSCSDLVNNLSVGVNKGYLRLPSGFKVKEVRASLLVPQAAGSIFTVDINYNGTSILSTKLTIDNGETTSVTATTPAVLSTTDLSDDGIITVDIDQVGTPVAKGLIVTLIPE